MAQQQPPAAFQTPPVHTRSLIADVRRYITEIANGGAPFGPAPQGVLRRAHADPRAGPGTVVVAAAPPPPPPWPDLPLGSSRTLPGAQVGRVMVMLLCDDEIAGSLAGAGLTPDRLRGMLRVAGLDDSMVGRVLPALALWLARAGALADAADGERPWATPRRLTTTDADAVAALLRATPPPDPDAVKAERGRGLK